MIAVIRISGIVKMNKQVENTLQRMGMMKKYTCVIVDNKKPEIEGMMKKIRNFVGYGEIDDKTLHELLKARAKKIGKKNAKLSESEIGKVAKEIMAGKKLSELGIKPYFGLHPARGGIDTKHHFPQGVLGNHKEAINKLIMRML